MHNALLCQLTSDACGLPVVAGPDEAAAIGNALVQAQALGILGAADGPPGEHRRSDRPACLPPAPRPRRNGGGGGRARLAGKLSGQQSG